MRRVGHAITYGEVDSGVIGVAVPILEDHNRIVGSMSYVIPAAQERAVARLVAVASAAAREIESGLRADSNEGYDVSDEAAKLLGSDS
jgi:DNA-binding IclR family transcriptional regulator